MTRQPNYRVIRPWCVLRVQLLAGLKACLNPRCQLLVFTNERVISGTKFSWSIEYLALYEILPNSGYRLLYTAPGVEDEVSHMRNVLTAVKSKLTL